MRWLFVLGLLVSCSSGPRSRDDLAMTDRDVQADVVEAKLVELGEKRSIAGAATEPLSDVVSVGSSLLACNVVHVFAGDLPATSPSNVRSLRVWLHAGRACRVAEFKAGEWRLVWEDWRQFETAAAPAR